MRARALVAGAALIGFGAFAATGFGGTGGAEDATLRTGPPVKLEIERVSAPEARAAGAVAAQRRQRFRVRFFVSEPVFVPARGVSEIGFMACPRRFAAISGFFITTGGIVPDHFFHPRPIRRWEFGFVNLTEEPGEARGGIACARIR